MLKEVSEVDEKKVKFEVPPCPPFIPSYTLIPSLFASLYLFSALPPPSIPWYTLNSFSVWKSLFSALPSSLYKCFSVCIFCPAPPSIPWYTFNSFSVWKSLFSALPSSLYKFWKNKKNVLTTGQKQFVHFWVWALFQNSSGYSLLQRTTVY